MLGDPLCGALHIGGRAGERKQSQLARAKRPRLGIGDLRRKATRNLSAPCKTKPIGAAGGRDWGLRIGDWGFEGWEAGFVVWTTRQTNPIFAVLGPKTGVGSQNKANSGGSLKRSLGMADWRFCFIHPRPLATLWVFAFIRAFCSSGDERHEK
jgi:hypothetical protein